MSATLNRALAAGNLRVRKAVSGEAVIMFRNPVLKTDDEGNRYSVNIAPVRLTSGRTIDMYARKEVDRDAVQQSNLKNLVERGVLDVV